MATSKRGSTGAGRITTADRVLGKALQLLNARGVQRVTHRDIAGALAISPGNLTYHFPKKGDIIHALVDRFEAELTAVVEQVPALGANMEEHAASLLRQLRVVWTYRFFFNDIDYLIDVEPSLKVRFRTLRETLVSLSADAWRALVANGSLKSIESPAAATVVVENIWYLWFSLIRLYPLLGPGRSRSERGFYRFAAAHLYAFLEPYYNDRVRAGFRDYLQQVLR